MASGAPGGGDVDDARVGARRARPPAATVSKTGTLPSSARLAALAGRHAGHDVGAVGLHLAGVEVALAAGDALDEQARRAIDEDAHAADSPRAATALARTASSRLLAVSMPPPPAQDGRGLLGVGAHDAHDHGHVARLLGARLDEAAGHLVAARDAAEDVDQDGPHVLVRQDQAHRRGHLVGARATADVQEVGRLAAGALDEVHRGHGQPGAVDHAADGALEPDEAEALGRAPRRRSGPPRPGRAWPPAPGGGGGRSRRW